MVSGHLEKDPVHTKHSKLTKKSRVESLRGSW